MVVSGCRCGDNREMIATGIILIGVGGIRSAGLVLTANTKRNLGFLLYLHRF